MNTKRISLSGTYYTFGEQFGVAAKQEIRKTLKIFQQSDQYTVVQKFLETTNGRALLHEFDTRVRAYCQDVVLELQGMADGAALDFRELFLLNLAPEWSTLLPGDKKQSTTDTDHSTTTISKGCTDIHLPIQGTEDVFLGHNEDINPKLRDCGYIVQANIYKDENREELIESFTDYVTAGVLPGGKFGFNRHGLMFGSIDVTVNEIYVSGLPRKFAMRPLVAAKDISSMKEILGTYPGLATGIVYSILCRELADNRTRTVDCVLEIAGDPQHGVVYQEYYPTSPYFHCNTLQHLQVPCYPGISTPRRRYMLERLVAENHLLSYDDLIKALCNQDNKQYPIFRTGEPPDRLATVAVAIFDSRNMTMTVYDAKPEECPGLQLPIDRK